MRTVTLQVNLSKKDSSTVLIAMLKNSISKKWGLKENGKANLKQVIKKMIIMIITKKKSKINIMTKRKGENSSNSFIRVNSPINKRKINNSVRACLPNSNNYIIKLE